MPQRTIPLTGVRVGDWIYQSGILVVRRDDPMPGVEGLRSWTVIAEGAGMIPGEDPIELVMETATGETFSGSASVRHSDGRQVTFLGTGPLDPQPEF